MKNDSKTTIYLNMVVKHQGEGWAHIKEKIDTHMLILHNVLMILFNGEEIGLIPTYHQYDIDKKNYYYKIEIKYPSILGVQEAIKID